jgi:tricarballylate dehydrogenase
MSDASNAYDVLIIGAGNAALCAAIAACERGAKTLVLEKAPEYFRGGNTYFTGGIIRFAYRGIEDIKALIPDMTPEEVKEVYRRSLE